MGRLSSFAGLIAFAKNSFPLMVFKSPNPHILLKTPPFFGEDETFDHLAVAPK
jgi:hypothetical protein